MTKTDDGGPAFPTKSSCKIDDDYRVHWSAAGMSLRDWFAGQALFIVGHKGILNREAIAELTYEIADAMLKERSKGALK